MRPGSTDRRARRPWPRRWPGRQARTAARHCQQVLAGIGFTTEHPLHHFIRRTLVLDALLGNAPSLTRALGTEVISSSRLPALPPL